MATVVDEELTQVIYQTLQSCLSPDKAIIKLAEQQLTVLQVRPEYCYILLNFILDQSMDFGIRQMGSVLFKQYVEGHWNKNSEKFKEPEIKDEVKQQIKMRLPVGLADSSSKIRLIVAYSVATIAQWDWPELWPELLNILMSYLSTSNSPSGSIDVNAVHGSLETLTEIVQEVTDIQMPQVAPVVIPQMYKIFIDPQNYSINLRKMSVEIFTGLVTVIAEMSEYDSTAGKKYLFPYMNDFMLAMVKALSMNGADAVNLVDNALKSEIIKALTALLKSYPKKIAPAIEQILTQVWTCLVQSSEIYSNKVVNSESFEDNAANDIEEEKTALENLVYQLFDFIIELKEKSRYRSTIKKAVDELVYYTILYMQIPDDRLEKWTCSPEEFIQDEDEDSYSYSVRVSGIELIESIAGDFKKETANAVLKATERHMELAQKLKETNSPNWWKIHEACLLAISVVKPILQELSTTNLLEHNVNALVNQFVIGCLHESNFPFLVGRALFTASKFPKMLTPETLEALLKITATTVQESQDPIIRLSAMKSCYGFIEELSVENQQSILLPHLPQITEGLIQMLTQNSTNQIGLLTMETLIVVLGVDENFVASMEHKLSPIAIALFLKNINDPMVNMIVTDIIKILICNQQTNEKMQQRIVPTLVSILNQSQAKSDDEKNFTALLTSTLDLITTVLRNTKQSPLSGPLIGCFFCVINLCMKSEDTAVLQSGCECLRAYISKSIDQIVHWKDDSGQSALNYIVLAINHMLDPKTSGSGCIGRLITTLMKHTAQVLGDNLDFILKAVLSKMQSSDVLAVQQSLIMVFANLMHSKMDAVLTFLSNLPGPTGKPSLEFLMTEWVGKATMFSGYHDCKISMLALAKILEHAISTEDQRFQNIFVRGDRIINPVQGITTRSKVKNEKELYTEVPLLVKIYKLLINELHGLLEEKKDQQDDGDYDDEDGDEEEYDDESEGVNENEIDIDSNGGSEAEHINNYLNKYDAFEDAFEKDEGDDDPEYVDDPLAKIDLLEYLSQYLQTLSQHKFFSFFVEHHNQMEKEVLKEIGISNA